MYNRNARYNQQVRQLRREMGALTWCYEAGAVRLRSVSSADGVGRALRGGGAGVDITQAR